MNQRKNEIKILCTIGPASLNRKTITNMDELNVDVFRINLSHTELERIEEIIIQLKSYTNKPICLDTEGAQIRTGYVENGRIFLENDQIVRITNEKIIGNAETISLNPSDVVSQIRKGDLISIDFESLLLQVTDAGPNVVKAKVVSNGYLGSNKAVNLDRPINLPTMSYKDKEAIKIGLKHGINHFALSFTNCRADVDLFREHVGENSHIICKIESLDGVNNVDEIIPAADAILIDRGDLSREVAMEKVPFIQKMIIKKANKLRVPVYVATNLLESMIKARTPTRAEVSDVVNTLIDGADGLVLAAETAIGTYPTNCVAMVSKLIHQFSVVNKKNYSMQDIHRKECFLLTEPHGGVLINRIKDTFDPAEARDRKILSVDRTVLMDAEQMAIGTFSPLEGFMGKKALDSVINHCRLPNNVVWPVPVVLQVDQQTAEGLKTGESIMLALADTGDLHAILYLDEIYQYDLKKIAEKVYGTLDGSHPGVQMLNKRGQYFLGGKIDLIKRLPSDYKHYEITPKQARMIFENRGWSKVIGFHTRNVSHRAHEHIQLSALEKYHCDGLFIHPIVGPKKEGDYNPGVILKSYELILDKHYPKGKAFLSAFQNYSRYAGPREAIFTALCRKNFGCSHFIVGRDHTGVGNYYGPNDAHDLFESLGDIGITPVFFNQVYYCKKCNQYVEDCEHGEIDAISISGTECRKMLSSNIGPPDWFMRKDISSLILNEIDNGTEVFVK